MRLAYLLKAWSSIGSVRNRILNACAARLTSASVSVDWRDLKIVHPKSIEIGSGFSSGRALWLESVEGKGRLTIGANVNVSDNVHIGCFNRIEIGDGVLIGSKVLINDHSHGRIDRQDGIGESDKPPNLRAVHSKGPIKIGRSVWIGDGVCVLAGVTIGDGAIVGANSVVLGDIPPGTIWAGTPARQLWPSHENVGPTTTLCLTPTS
ncbi:MAG: hypothetical protein ABI781_00645 [Burkholderiales bacterium]